MPKPEPFNRRHLFNPLPAVIGGWSFGVCDAMAEALDRSPNVQYLADDYAAAAYQRADLANLDQRERNAAVVSRMGA